MGSLREKLLDAHDAGTRLRVLHAWLLRQQPAPVPPVVSQSLRLLGCSVVVTRIDIVADACGLSPRRLRQVFAEHVGMTPKRWWRLQRFGLLVGQAHARPQVDWAALAAAGGFADQAHLSHEFRAFSGMTPGQYLAANAQWAQHVPLPGTP